MVLFYGCIDIVIKRSALEKIKKGLSDEFIGEYKIKEGHFDDNLIVIPGGMNPYDVENEVNILQEKYGLVHLCNNVAQDFVCVEPFGICSKCLWLNEYKLNKDLKIGNKVYPKNFPYFEFINDLDKPKSLY